MALTITQQDKEGITLLELSGKFIFGEECKIFNKQMEDLLEENRPRIVLNMEGISFCDSSGLGCLITALKATRDRGGDLKLLRLSKELQVLLDLTKLNTVFDIHTSEEEALASFK